MRVFTTPWVRANLSANYIQVMQRGEPHDARISLFAKSANGPFTAQLSLANGTGAVVHDSDCERAVQRVLVATTRKNLDRLG
jgi:hypothetical protein